MTKLVQLAAERCDASELPSVQKPAAIKELCALDIAVLQETYHQLTEKIWQVHDDKKENKFDCFEYTQHVIFRFPDNLHDPRHFNRHPIDLVFGDKIITALAPVIDCYDFNCPVIPKMMIARLEAGRSIRRHVDGQPVNRLVHKIHVPLVSNPGAIFYSGDQSAYLEVGKAYEVNNIVRHGVENHGEQARVHLIFELFDLRAGE